MCPATADRSIDVVYPRGIRLSPGQRRWKIYFAPLLVPASCLYHSVSSAVRGVRMIDAGETPESTMVISIGNLEVGGSGKTPLALYLVERLCAEGGAPVYISRGYKSISEKFPGSTVVLPSNGPLRSQGRPLADVRYVGRNGPALAADIGDEGAMVAARVPSVPLVFSRRKDHALRVATEMFGPSHVIMDDAFQSWGVPRDIDVVLLNCSKPFGSGWLIPAGSLREIPEALERANVIGINGADGPAQLADVDAEIFRTAGIHKPLFGIQRQIEIRDTGDTGGTLEQGGIPGRVAVLSSIGRPGAFEQVLRAQGIHPAISIRYPDHHSYTNEDVRWLLQVAGGRDIGRIITTEKDWAKLRDFAMPANLFAVARLRLVILGHDPLTM